MEVIDVLIVYNHSSLIASTGFMLIALHAGARPARPPRTLSKAAAAIAVQKPTWKWAVRMPSVVFANSNISNMDIPKRMPLIPDRKSVV